MGLIRRVLKLAVPVAAFSVGYYIGTVDSGKYECIFEQSQVEYGLEKEVGFYEDEGTKEYITSIR